MADYTNEDEVQGADVDGYASDEWQQNDAYAAAVPMPMPFFPVGVPYWQPPVGVQKYTSSNKSPFVGGQKQRFCATFPNVTRCRHGNACTFAHTREEVNAPLLSPDEEMYVPDALTEDFFTNRFKTLWCPIGAQHDWQACMYAHTFQDARRPPSIGYGHQLCPYWNKKDTSLAYSQRCPLGPRCPHAHGAKEQLYHPHYFRTLVCRDLQRRRCPRGQLCAFFHRQSDARHVGPDPVDYATPLRKEDIPPEWVSYFLSPPRFQEAGMEDFGAEQPVVPFGLPGGCGGCAGLGAFQAQGGHFLAPPSGAAASALGYDMAAAARPQKAGRSSDTPRTQTSAEEEEDAGGEDSVEELSGGEEASLQMAAAAAASWPTGAKGQYGMPGVGAQAPGAEGWGAGEEGYWGTMPYYGMASGYMFEGYPSPYMFDAPAMYAQGGNGGWGGMKGGGRGGGKGRRKWQG